ncbi:MAG: hypothetical protein AB3A66_07305 [Nodularia sp. CChRGM 3473]
MTRQEPPNNGKPRKTEPGAIRVKSQKNIIDKQQDKKLDGKE